MRHSATGTRLRERVLARPEATGQTRVVALVVALGVTGLVGATDAATGSRVSFGLFYLVPIAVGTIVVGTRGGALLAATATVLWALADVAATPHGDLDDYLWNVPLRLGILTLVVALLAALREALRRSIEGERRSREFLAYAAHQLRTPVAAMRTNAEALLATQPGAEPERLLANLVGEAGRAGRLIASLLRVARLDQERAPAAAPFDPVLACRVEVDRADRLTPHDVLLQIEPPVPQSVAGDVDGFREAIANVLDNSRRHARSTITVHVSARRGTVAVVVIDDGPGVPIDLGDRVFDRFVSLDGRGGSGLGLAIARDLLRRQGGDISVRDGYVELCLPSTQRARRRIASAA